MSATATLPLPLELTAPAALDCDPDTQLKEMFKVGITKYNAETQLRENPAGIPMILDASLITISVLASTVSVLGGARDSDRSTDDHGH
jgi:hypothetical protein